MFCLAVLLSNIIGFCLPEQIHFKRCNNRLTWEPSPFVGLDSVHATSIPSSAAGRQLVAKSVALNRKRRKDRSTEPPPCKLRARMPGSRLPRADHLPSLQPVGST